jgi:prepilin-type processing-associated H-X9-DG protein
LLRIQLFSDDTQIINEYFQKKECKDIIDRIIANAGGEENIKKANSSTYEVFINLNLIDLKISYKQLVKRSHEMFKMEKEVLGEKVVTGFDGNEMYQSAYGKLFKIPEFKQEEIAFAFHSAMPHQFVLKLKQKDFALKYLGVQDWSGKKVNVFQHLGVAGEEKYYYDTESLNLVYSTSMATGLLWEVTRDFYKKQDNILYPVSTKMKLNNEELYSMTITSMSFDVIDVLEFKKPNQETVNASLQPFAGQMRLQEICKALKLFREYDPVNHSFPLPEKVKSIMGVQPQLGQPTLKIGFKNMFTYQYCRGDAAELLDLETYPYILKGNVHKNTPIVWDKKGNYKTGRNVLFADGSISFVNENQFESYFQAAIKRYPVIEVEMEKE